MNFAFLHCSLLHLVAVWRSGKFPFPKWAASLLKQKERKTKQLEATLFVFYQSRQDILSLWWLRDDLTNSEKTTVTVNVSSRGWHLRSHSNVTVTVVLLSITSRWRARQRFPTSAWALCPHSAWSALLLYIEMDETISIHWYDRTKQIIF